MKTPNLRDMPAPAVGSGEDAKDSEQLGKSLSHPDMGWKAKNEVVQDWRPAGFEKSNLGGENSAT